MMKSNWHRTIMKTYKKFLAVFLTVILTFSGTAICYAAEDAGAADVIESYTDGSDELAGAEDSDLILDAAEADFSAEIKGADSAEDMTEIAPAVDPEYNDASETADSGDIDIAPEAPAEEVAEEPLDEAEVVAAAPSFNLKSMQLVDEDYLFFANSTYSFDLWFKDADGNYLTDCATIKVRTTYAAEEIDFLWFDFTETGTTSDPDEIRFDILDKERDANGLWTITLGYEQYDINNSGDYRLTRVLLDADGQEYIYKSATELKQFRNYIDTIHVKTLQEVLSGLPTGTNAYFDYLRNPDGTPFTIPEGITVGADRISDCTTPLYVNGSFYTDLGTDGLTKIVFGTNGKEILYRDLIQNLPVDTNISELLKHLRPNDTTKKLRFYPFGTSNASYVWNGSSWQNENGLPEADQIKAITGKTSLAKDGKDHWYSYDAKKDGYYQFRLSFTSYQYEQFELYAYLMDNLGNMTELVKLEEDSYGDYSIDGVYLKKGTRIYIKVKNTGCTGAYLEMVSYQPEKNWIATVLDFDNAKTSVTYSKDHAFVTATIPILDLTKWNTIDYFTLTFKRNDGYIISLDQQSVKDGVLTLSQKEGEIVNSVVAETRRYETGDLSYWFEGDDPEDEGELHELEFRLAGDNYAVPSEGTILIPEAFTVNLTTRKYVAGSLTINTNKTQPKRTSYFYKVVIDPYYVEEDGYTYEEDQIYCFTHTGDSVYFRLYRENNKEVSGSNGCYELRSGTYYLQVANNTDATTTIKYFMNTSVPTVSEVKLGLTTFASMQAVPLTVNYQNDYKLAEVELRLENANGDQYELKQYKVTSDTGKVFKSIVYLDRDEDVTAKGLKITRVYIRDIYGKSTTIFAENLTATWTTRTHQLVTKANRFSYSANNEQPVNFIRLEEGDITIPLFAVVNVYESVNLSSPDSLKVYGTLNTRHLSLWGWGDPIEITVDGTIYAGAVDIQTFVLKGKKTGHIIITGDINDPNYVENILDAPKEASQEEVDSYLTMLREILTAETEGTSLLVAVVWSYYAWRNGEWVYDYAAFEGLTTSCGMQFNDKTFIYDGKYHSLEVENKSDAVRVTYENNNHKEPGTYVVTAHFRAPKGYNQESFYDLTAVMTIVKAASFTLSEEDGVNIPAGSTLPLVAETSSGSTVSSLQWSSSDTSVATVDANGVVTGKTYGKAVITAKTKDGSMSAKRLVKVVFSDVTRENSKEAVFTAVCWLADRGISRGYGGVTFGPNNNCTRQEFTIFMYRAAGKPTVNNQMLSALKFSDIGDCSATAKNAIAWAVSAGIIKGYSDGTFRPNDNITRDSMAVMFYRAAGSPAVTQAQINALTFKDISGCSASIKKAIAWAVSAGIIKGYSDGSGNFGPRDNSLRSQVAIMLYRFYK